MVKATTTEKVSTTKTFHLELTEEEVGAVRRLAFRAQRDLYSNDPDRHVAWDIREALMRAAR